MDHSRRHFLQSTTAGAALIPLLMSMEMDYCEAATQSAADMSMGFPDKAVRLNWNENTLGPSPLAIEGAMEGLKDSYRYALGGLLTPYLAEYHGVDKDWILMGTGSTELQRLAPATHLKAGDNVVSSVETWAGGLRVAEHMGVEVKTVPLLKQQGFKYDIDGLLSAVNDKTRLFIMVTPNNPTGTALEYGQLKKIADSLPKHTLLILDEAYAEYLPEGWKTGIDLLKEGYENVLVTRTFSKAHGLAGLRCGYGMGHPDILRTVKHFGCGPASISIVVFGAVQGALADPEHARRSRTYVENCRRYYEKNFAGLGLKTASGVPPFIMVQLGDRTAEIHAKLKKRNIFVGNGKSWNAPDYLRVSYGREKENDAFFRELRKIL